ncbi:hypothetical protein BJF88_04875 [Cellulosimicrobium sp. CUA-896]|nr:hypothetical protein BJF88_04875 [Cellulosimicrobium sp. CUA-896]
MDDDRWWWSAGVYAILGLQPGEVVPTTQLLLAHRHPDDTRPTGGTLLEALAEGEPFSHLHRIVDAHGATRTVVVTGTAVRDDAGRVVEVTGDLVDVTASVAARSASDANRQISDAFSSRGRIEQAKGAVAIVLGLDPEEAFSLLCAASSLANVRVRDLADELVSCLADLDPRADRRALVSRILHLP